MIIILLLYEIYLLNGILIELIQYESTRGEKYRPWTNKILFSLLGYVALVEEQQTQMSVSFIWRDREWNHDSSNTRRTR
jgi:predicted ATPase